MEGSQYLVSHPHSPVKLLLSRDQVMKFARGHPIQIKYTSINHPHGHVFRHLHPTNLEKLHKAHTKGKGVRLHLTLPEAHGSGLLDFLKGIAPTVLNGIAGAAKEIFPGNDQLINSVRGAVKSVTGFGICPKTGTKHSKSHKVHHAHEGGFSGPSMMPGHCQGSGIVPAGYY